MAFNYDVLTDNCSKMKETSNTFSTNCNGMNTLVSDEVLNDKTWLGDSARRFKSDWDNFSEDFPTYKRTFDQQVDTLQSAIDAYHNAEG